MRLSSSEKQQIPGSSLLHGKGRIIESQSIYTPENKPGYWIALALCAMVIASGVLVLFLGNQPEIGKNPTPGWIPIVAAMLAAAGIIQLNDHPLWLRIQGALLWSGLLMMVWAANGLLFDLLRLTPLMPISDVDWPGMATRALTLFAAVMIARIALELPIERSAKRQAVWYGYVAFVLALPYPVLRTCWAFGGMIGLTEVGAAGSGFEPLIIAIPWILAAVLSLFLVSTPNWMPRRLLLTAGWTATVIVAMIGPAAFWMIISSFVNGGAEGPKGMAGWVPFLFYGSWFLFAIAIGAATRSYQLRSAGSSNVSANATGV